MTSYKEKLNDINTFVFDMDGVLTNGRAFLFKGEVMRNFFSKDGYAIQFAAKKGYKMFIISGGHSVDVSEKMVKLGMTEVVLGASKKTESFKALQEKYNFTAEECLYMGDDIPDIPLLKIAGLSTCPQDAAQEIKMIVDYVSPYNGGEGCVRDVIEQTMKVRGDWMSDGAYEW